MLDKITLDKITLDYDDVSLIPTKLSTVSHRNECSTEITIPYIDLTMTVPIISSPMKDVTDGKMSKAMINTGGLGILHRFCSIDEQVAEYNLNKNAAAAIGINGDYFHRFKALYNEGCRLFCIDVANGATTGVRNVLEEIANSNLDAKFIVGNVASEYTYNICANFPNVIGVRVGIAGGNACTTKNATGIYCPALSLIAACKYIQNTLRLESLIIADGGIRGPADFCKAIAFGADCVMLGSALAVAEESPAEIVYEDEGTFKIYRGSASESIQKLYRDKPNYIEGQERYLEYKGENVDDIVSRFRNGLRSSMSYFNARTIEEYRKNVKYVVVK